jgi:hypothetical protein
MVETSLIKLSLGPKFHRKRPLNGFPLMLYLNLARPPAFH